MKKWSVSRYFSIAGGLLFAGYSVTAWPIVCQTIELVGPGFG